MLKDIYTTPEVEILKFKAALAIAADPSSGGDFEVGEDGDDEDGDL